jgi:hypothetical protein
MANADLRALWDNLPDFVYGYTRGRVVPKDWGAFEIRDRPVIFFHAEKPIECQLSIGFFGGMPGVWWPGTLYPAIRDKKPIKIEKRLEWDLGIKQIPMGWQPKSKEPPEVANDHWFKRLRQVKSEEIFARYGLRRDNVDREKFVYYDGLFPHAKWVKITVEKDSVAVSNRAGHALFDVTVVDRRNEGKVRIGRLAQFDAGANLKNGVNAKTIDFAEVDTTRFVSEASDLLVKQLTVAGLNEDEAGSLVDLWKKEFFETPGLHVFYRLPQDEYDFLLPMKLSPKADSVVRVGLVFHGHLEPELPDRILELVKQLDSPRFAIRNAALKNLQQIGPAALVHLERLQKMGQSTEVQNSLEHLLKTWSAKKAFE